MKRIWWDLNGVKFFVMCSFRDSDEHWLEFHLFFLIWDIKYLCPGLIFFSCYKRTCSQGTCYILHLLAPLPCGFISSSHTNNCLPLFYNERFRFGTWVSFKTGGYKSMHLLKNKKRLIHLYFIVWTLCSAKGSFLAQDLSLGSFCPQYFSVSIQP